MAPDEPFHARQTFLRHHIPRVRRLEMGSADWEGIAALRDLPHEVARPARLTLEAFLFGGEPELPAPLYRPVGLDSLHGPTTSFLDIVDLLKQVFPPCARDSTSGRSGVVLQGESGSGKTVSLYRAFFACFRAAASEPSPPLAGYLPCLIDGHSLPAGDYPDWRSLLAALASRGFPQHVPTGPVADWVRIGPPLLLLCDLDTIPERQRRSAANLLRQFGRDQMHVAGDRSCCVVAAIGAHEAAWGVLRDTQFERYFLKPWERDQACSYAAGWRAAAKIPDAADEMNFPWDLLPGRVHQVLTLPQRAGQRVTHGTLLNGCVERQMPRLHEAASSLGASPPDVREPDSLALALITRLALALHHGRTITENSLTRTEAESSIRRPAETSWYRCLKDAGFWVPPNGGDYHPYFQNPPSESSRLGDWMCALVRERPPFMRGDDLSIAFAGGEMQAYFEGVMATRFWQRPFQPPLLEDVDALQDGWHQAVLARWAHDPRRFAKAAELLGGVVQEEDLDRLLECFFRRQGEARRNAPTPRLWPLLKEALSGWEPQDGGARRLCWALHGLEDARTDMDDKDVFSYLESYFRCHAKECVTDLYRLAGQEGPP